jgi:hypothetical protein
MKRNKIDQLKDWIEKALPDLGALYSQNSAGIAFIAKGWRLLGKKRIVEKLGKERGERVIARVGLK